MNVFFNVIFGEFNVSVMIKILMYYKMIIYLLKNLTDAKHLNK